MQEVRDATLLGTQELHQRVEVDRIDARPGPAQLDLGDEVEVAQTGSAAHALGQRTERQGLSIRYPQLGRTPARCRLAAIAERDARLSQPATSVTHARQIVPARRLQRLPERPVPAQGTSANACIQSLPGERPELRP